jgi:hypothetical protein
MAYIAMASLDMVTIRRDWVWRSRAAMGKGPYPTDALGRMEYDSKNNHIRFIY